MSGGDASSSSRQTQRKQRSAERGKGYFARKRSFPQIGYAPDANAGWCGGGGGCVQEPGGATEGRVCASAGRRYGDGCTQEPGGATETDARKRRSAPRRGRVCARAGRYAGAGGVCGSRARGGEGGCAQEPGGAAEGADARKSRAVRRRGQCVPTPVGLAERADARKSRAGTPQRAGVCQRRSARRRGRMRANAARCGRAGNPARPPVGPARSKVLAGSRLPHATKPAVYSKQSA